MTVIDLLAEAAYAYPTPSRSSDRHSEPVSPNLVTYVECLRTDSERRAANRFHSSSDIFSSLSRRCGSPWLSDSNRFVSSTRQVSQCSMWRRTNNNSSLSQSGSLCNSMANAPFDMVSVRSSSAVASVHSCHLDVKPRSRKSGTKTHFSGSFTDWRS